MSLAVFIDVRDPLLVKLAVVGEPWRHYSSATLAPER